MRNCNSLFLVFIIAVMFNNSNSAIGYDDLSLADILSLEVVSSNLKQSKFWQAPSNIIGITAAEIKRKGYRTIKDVLMDMPGFTDVYDVNEELGAVRGTFASTNNKTMIMINGHRMNENFLGRYNLDQFFEMHLVERIEFIKGAGSALYGTGALNGLVNIILKDASGFNGKDLFRARAGTGHGELSYVYADKTESGAQFWSSFTYLDAEGNPVNKNSAWDTAAGSSPAKEGQIYHDRFENNWAFTSFFTRDNSSLLVRKSHFQRITPLLASGGTYDYKAEIHKPRYTQDDFMIEYIYKKELTANSSIDFIPSFHEFTTIEQSFITTGIDETPPLGSRSGVLTREQNVRLKSKYENQLVSNFNLITGIDAVHTHYPRNDVIAISSGEYKLTKAPDVGGSEVGVFAQGIWDVSEKLEATVGVRYDEFKVARIVESTATSPRLGIVYNVSEKSSFKLLYGSAFLAPRPFHLASTDPNFLGNKDLKAETLTSVDFIYSYVDSLSHIFTLNLFQNTVRNLINKINVGGKDIYKNLGQATYSGYEVDLKYFINKKVNVAFNYSSVSAGDFDTEAESRLMNNDKNMTLVPSSVIRYGVNYSPSDKAKISFWGRTFGSEYAKNLNDGEAELGDRTILDLSLLYQTSEDTDWQLIAKNIANTEYEVGETGTGTPRHITRAGSSYHLVYTHSF